MIILDCFLGQSVIHFALELYSPGSVFKYFFIQFIIFLHDITYLWLQGIVTVGVGEDENESIYDGGQANSGLPFFSDEREAYAPIVVYVGMEDLIQAFEFGWVDGVGFRENQAELDCAFTIGRILLRNDLNVNLFDVSLLRE